MIFVRRGRTPIIYGFHFENLDKQNYGSGGWAALFLTFCGILGWFYYRTHYLTHFNEIGFNGRCSPFAVEGMDMWLPSDFLWYALPLSHHFEWRKTVSGSRFLCYVFFGCVFFTHSLFQPHTQSLIQSEILIANFILVNQFQVKSV